jgi:hypothetical protein
MEFLARITRLLILLCLGCACAAARAQSNSVSIGLTSLIIQGELNQFKTSIPFQVEAAPAYAFSITGNVHGEGPVFSVLAPASEPAAAAFDAIHQGLSSALQGNVPNPGSQLPANILSEQVTSGTDGVFNATFSLSIDATGEVDFTVTNVALVIDGQPDTTDRLVFDSGSVTVTALSPDVSVATLSATNVTVRGATLQSSVICPNPFQAYFVYGAGTSLSGTSSMVSLASSGSAQQISIALAGLLPHQIYHYRAAAADVTGPSYGVEAIFKTADNPPVAGNLTAFAGTAPLPIPVLTVCSDPDGDVLKVTKVSAGGAGKSAITAGGKAVTYQFQSNSQPLDHFDYTISDGFGGTATGQVNLVNYATLAGAYCALLLNPGAQNSGAGFLRLTLAGTGRCTGSLTIAGVAYPFAGAFNSSGNLSVTISTPGTPFGTTITLAMVQDGAGYQLSAGVAMNALRLAGTLPPASAALAGTYTMALPPPPGASYVGCGYAVLKVASTGLATLSGALPDGAPFTCSTTFDAANQAGVFSLLYAAANRGSLAGTLTVSGSTNALISGDLVWTKPALASAGIDQGPFSISLSGSGGVYVAPVHAAALQFGNGSNTGRILLSGGNLNSPLDYAFSLSPSNAVAFQAAQDHGLTLTISAATGLFSGHYIDPLNAATRTFHGVLLQGSESGAGYFLGDSEGGMVEIGPP